MKHIIPDTAGVPLGGLGTGTFQLRRDGSFHEWQIFNNWGNWTKLPPIQFGMQPQPLHLTGALLAVKFMKPDGTQDTRILEGRSRNDLLGISRIDFQGRFPVVKYSYRDFEDYGINMSLTAFAPFVPHDIRLSSIPAAGFCFQLQNNSQEKISYAIILSLENPFGENAQIRQTQDGLLLHLMGPGNGGIAMGCSSEDASAYLPDPDVKTASAYLSKLTNAFGNKGEFGRGNREQKTAYGALCISDTLQAGEGKQHNFTIGWFYPEHGYKEYAGHIYELHYGSALQVVENVLHNFADIHARVLEWVDTIYAGDLPHWFKDFISNSLSMFTKNTLYARNGGFGILESFECPSVDNLHVHLPGAVALPVLFPELEAAIIRKHACGQAANGRMCEEFDPGVGRLNPDNRWGRDFADLPACFTLSVYRYLVWTGDQSLLQDIWPNVKQAFKYGDERDTDGDGLPNRSNGQNTYDIPTWNCGDQMSYTASLWLAALRAGKNMAKLMKDADFASWCDEKYRKGRTAMEQKLFNGEFYALGETSGNRVDACMVEQLTGQWSANLTGLGPILPKEHIDSAIRSVLKYNVANTRYGAVNSVFPDGTRDSGDPSGRDTRFAEAVWPGATYVFAVLAMQEGFVAEGLALLERCYTQATRILQDGLWNLPDITDPDTGLRHKWYFSNYQRAGSIWSALQAISGFNYDALHKSLSVRPILQGDHLVAPFVTCRSFGTFELGQGPDSFKLSVAVRAGVLELASIIIPGQLGQRVILETNGTATHSECKVAPGICIQVVFAPIKLRGADVLLLRRI